MFESEDVRHKNNRFVNLKKKMYRRELVAILIFVVLIMLNNAWIIFTQKSQDDKIHRLDAKLSHEAQVSDENSADTLLERIKQEELNKTKRELSEAVGRITELERNFTSLQGTLDSMGEKLSDMSQRMSMVERELSTVRAKIADLNGTKASRVSVERLTSELDARKVDKAEFEILSHNLTLLRESTSREDEEIREELSDSALNQTHCDQLQDGIDRLEESKADQTALEVVVVTLSELANSTVTILKTVDAIENTTQILEGHTLQLETEVDSARAAIADLNTTKASKEDLSHLTTEIMVLEARKVDKVEFEIVSHNLTILTESTSREDEEIREDVAELAATRATNEDLRQLTTDVMLLDARKVDRMEFELLSGNLTLLRESLARDYEEIYEDLAELSGSALNYTHHDQLQRGIDRLEASKANQTALEEVVLTVSNLENSTVSISKLVVQVALNVTTLEQHTREALTTKADQRDIDSLSDRLTALSDTTVTTETFERLEDRVETLSTNKAEQSDLNELKTTVRNLNETAATEYEVDQLERRVTNHTASSDSKHEELASDISDNERNIKSNSDRIENMTGNTASSHVLTSSWMITIVTLVTTINTCFYTHTLHL